MPRAKADINPLKVRALIAEGAKVNEIAEYFGVHRDVIHDRFPTELTKGKADLRESLRRTQIREAKKGNATMLIWLGKQYLGQSDTTIDDYILEAIESQGLTKEDLLELIKNKDRLLLAQPKKNFQEFCEVAGYPVPYPKQIEFMTFAMYESVTRLLLGARGYGKTDYAVIMGIAYRVYLDPGSETNLIVTKSKERNASMLREIAEACQKNGVVFDRSNATHLRARGLEGKDHSVSAVTIRTVTLRGRHPKRVIMDDPVTEDDSAEAARLVAEKKYYEIMKLTQNVLIIGQPAHKYDLYAKLRGIVKTLEAPHGTIPELDHDLEAQKLAGVDDASISASYHLKILSEGTSPFDAVTMIDRFPVGDGAVAFIDPSEGGDYTAISIMRGYNMQRAAFVGFVYKRAWNHCLDEIAAHLVRFNVRRLAFETNCTGEQPIELLRTVFGGVGVVGRRANNNKHSRIMAAGAFAHLIDLSKESDKTYLDHVIKYEYKSKYDDAPDSLASCLEWVGLIRGKK
jgi:hypothetical protein